MKLIRLHFIVEGHAEEGFINRVLRPEFAKHEIFIDARRVLTGSQGNTKFRGGLKNYEKLSNDIVLWMKEDSGPESWFTSMIDYYGLPTNFPGYSDCVRHSAALDKVECLEVALATDIQKKIDRSESQIRFVPHIQLHEFETLLFSNIGSFLRRFPGSEDEIAKLRGVLEIAGTPEEINGGDNTHPSARIRQTISRYDKRSDGVELATITGLECMRNKCSHFNSWIDKLLKLN